MQNHDDIAALSTFLKNDINIFNKLPTNIFDCSDMAFYSFRSWFLHQRFA